MFYECFCYVLHNGWQILFNFRFLFWFRTAHEQAIAKQAEMAGILKGFYRTTCLPFYSVHDSMLSSNERIRRIGKKKSHIAKRRVST